MKRPAEGWYGSALCAQVDPGIFFADQGVNSSYARRICNNCPVLDDCKADTLFRDFSGNAMDIHGMAAGLSPYKRKLIRAAAKRALHGKRATPKG